MAAAPPAPPRSGARAGIKAPPDYGAFQQRRRDAALGAQRTARAGRLQLARLVAAERAVRLGEGDGQGGNALCRAGAAICKAPEQPLLPPCAARGPPDRRR
jgi:hypothetical protein